jgi:hypothetical protein
MSKKGKHTGPVETAAPDSPPDKELEKQQEQDLNHLKTAKGGKSPQQIAEGPESSPGFLKKVGRALGRTLTRKNKAGKILSHIVVAAGSLILGSKFQPLASLLQPSPDNLQPFILPIMHISILSIILFVLIAALTFLTSRGVLKGKLNKLAEKFLSGLKKFQTALSPDSPGGSDITKEEREKLMKEAYEDLLFAWNIVLKHWVFRLFGLSKKHHEQKVPDDES